MELPEPFQLPEKFMKEFCAYKYHNEHFTNDLIALRDKCDRLIQNDINLKKRQLERWWKKVEKEMSKNYTKEQIASVFGMEVDEQRGQIVFLSERKLFEEQIENLPVNIQNILMGTIGKQLEDPVPSSKQLGQMVDDFLVQLFKK